MTERASTSGGAGQRGDFDAGDLIVASGRRDLRNGEYRCGRLVVSSRTHSAAPAFLVGLFFERSDLLAGAYLDNQCVPGHRDTQSRAGRHTCGNNVLVGLPQPAEGTVCAKGCVGTTRAGRAEQPGPAVIKRLILGAAVRALGLECKAKSRGASRKPKSAQYPSRTARARQSPASQNVEKADRRRRLYSAAVPYAETNDRICSRRSSFAKSLTTWICHQMRLVHGSDEANVRNRVTSAGPPLEADPAPGRE